MYAGIPSLRKKFNINLGTIKRIVGFRLFTLPPGGEFTLSFTSFMLELKKDDNIYRAVTTAEAIFRLRMKQ